MSYFCVEPYVHVKVLSDRALFYNYVDNNMIICNHELVVNFAKKLISYENSFVCNVTDEEIGFDEIREFIHNMRDSFMGDYLEHK